MTLQLTPEAEPEDRIGAFLDRITALGQQTDLSPLLDMLERLCCAMENMMGAPQVMIAPAPAPQVDVHPVVQPPAIPAAEVTIQPEIVVQAGDNVIQPAEVKVVFPRAATQKIVRDSRGFIESVRTTYEY